MEGVQKCEKIIKRSRIGADGKGLKKIKKDGEKTIRAGYLGIVVIVYSFGKLRDVPSLSLLHGAEWCRVVQSGAEWCRVVQRGARTDQKMREGHTGTLGAA